MTAGAWVALLLGVLSGLGVGSAGLLLLWLTLVEGVPQLSAQGLNLLFFVFSAGAAVIFHAFRTRLPLKCIFWMLPTGLVGALLGSWLATLLPQALLRRGFGLFLVFCGALNLRRKRGNEIRKFP